MKVLKKVEKRWKDENWSRVMKVLQKVEKKWKDENL